MHLYKLFNISLLALILMLGACNEETTTSNEVDPSASLSLCKIKSSGNNNFIETPCKFSRQANNGSFSIQRNDQTPIIDEVMLISVTIAEAGKAEVYRLTSFGNNSRWGSANQSNDDPACWTGADFDICVYASKPSENDDNNNGA